MTIELVKGRNEKDFFVIGLIAQKDFVLKNTFHLSQTELSKVKLQLKLYRKKSKREGSNQF
jgi:hypothetical protein